MSNANGRKERYSINLVGGGLTLKRKLAKTKSRSKSGTTKTKSRSIARSSR